MKHLGNIKRLTSFLIAVGLAAPFMVPIQKAHADPSCLAGKVMNIVAHQDDDLLFMNPDIQDDIDGGRCVETVYVTAGDAGGSSTYWQNRESGMRAAYAVMANESNSWTTSAITLLGHTLQLSVLDGQPEVTLLFMRLPDGGRQPNDIEGFAATSYLTLKKLWEQSISTSYPVDGSASYTRQALIDVLRARMASYAPTTIRTLDYTLGYDEGDHLDHQSVAYFTREAQRGHTVQGHTLVGYKGYPKISAAENVTGIDLAKSQNAYFAYDAIGNYGKCTGTGPGECDDQVLLDWMERQYTIGSEGGSSPSWDWETVEGDTGSLSHYDGNVGRQPVSIEFGSDLYTFYYDVGVGDLRYAKKSGDAWSFATLDGSGGPNGRYDSDLGQTPNAVVYGNALHVFYYDASNGNIRHAFSVDGSVWSFENLDGDPGSLGGMNSTLGQTPTTILYGGSLHVFYYDAGNTNLRHAFHDSNGWHFENLEGDPGSISHYTSNIGLDPTAVLYGNALHLFYYDVDTGNLRHAFHGSAGWHFENLDGDPGSIGGRNANLGQHPAASVWNGTLHVFYTDDSAGDLRHMWTSPTVGWQTENLIGDGNAVIRYSGVIGYTTVSLASEGSLTVLTYEPGTGDLVRLWDDGTGWKEEHIDGFGVTPAGGVGDEVGLDPTAIMYGSALHLFYYDVSNGNLRHAIL